ncbi:MAG: acetaldehyde dehydrogenase (acetylating), partial [Firmicutes bacterium]|nr:acetaldehyde dehydrogenase (acetylating) [Bacillota bacterium]
MIDRDLASIAEARRLIERAQAAQEKLLDFSQADIDRVCAKMAEVGYANAGSLASMAVEETGLGVVKDKVVKNQFATKNVWDHIRGLRTVGIISEDPVRGVSEIAVPLGVIAGLLPTTNPTSTAMFKAIVSVKARNAIVFSPHPRAAKCSCAAARLMNDAAREAGAPDGVVGCLESVTEEGTRELMHHRQVAAILATGGTAMVRAAYSSGKPAWGVGPGNVPAFIERTADIPRAVSDILASKTFDNGTICASEQAIVTETAIEADVLRELSAQGAHILSEAEAGAVQRVVVSPTGGINPKVVGQSAAKIAEMAGIRVPSGTRVLVARLSGVGREHPLSMEKLCPVLAFYSERDWESACERCIELLKFGGLGHSLAIHSRNEAVIREFALKKPVFRILVNTPSSQGAIGFTTGLHPSLTLGCGAWGGNITSDNVGPLHLINIKRLARHVRDLGGGKPVSRGEEADKPAHGDEALPGAARGLGAAETGLSRQTSPNQAGRPGLSP